MFTDFESEIRDVSGQALIGMVTIDRVACRSADYDSGDEEILVPPSVFRMGVLMDFSAYQKLPASRGSKISAITSVEDYVVDGETANLEQNVSIVPYLPKGMANFGVVLVQRIYGVGNENVKNVEQRLYGI